MKVREGGGEVAIPAPCQKAFMSKMGPGAVGDVSYQEMLESLESALSRWLRKLCSTSLQ